MFIEIILSLGAHPEVSGFAFTNIILLRVCAALLKYSVYSRCIRNSFYLWHMVIRSSGSPIIFLNKIATDKGDIWFLFISIMQFIKKRCLFPLKEEIKITYIRERKTFCEKGGIPFYLKKILFMFLLYILKNKLFFKVQWIFNDKFSFEFLDLC